MRYLRIGPITAALLAATLCFLARPASAQIKFTIQDLGDLGGGTSFAFGVNSSGQVIGYSVTTTGDTHAFRTAPNSAINPATDDLGTLGGDSFGNALNNAGQAVGSSFNGITFHAFRTAPNGPISLATDLSTLGDDSYAYGINSAGQAVGYSFNGTANHAYRTTAGGIITAGSDMGTLGGSTSFARGINDNGQVVGYSDTAAGATHAFRTAPNSAINPATDDLGTLGGSNSAAYGINPSGQVVGNADTAAGATHAFRTAPNSAINPVTDDLGTLGGTNSFAFALNDVGQVVGFSDDAAGDEHAFLFDGSSMLDLNDLLTGAGSSGWVLTDARGINNLDQIVGTGTINGNQHAFLLTPAASPEPGTLSLLGGIALATTLSLRRRRKNRQFPSVKGRG